MSVRFPTLLGAIFGFGFTSAAGAGDLGYPASALGEFAAKPRSSFENAPSLAAPALAVPLSSDQAVSPAPASEPKPGASATPAVSAPAPVAEAEPETTATSPRDRPSSQDWTSSTPTSAPGAAALDEYEARCFVKIDGRVLTAKSCRILREKDKEVIFEIDEGPLTIKIRQGRVWTARLKDRDFGNVYKTGPCWGAHGFYACDRGRS